MVFIYIESVKSCINWCIRQSSYDAIAFFFCIHLHWTVTVNTTFKPCDPLPLAVKLEWLVALQNQEVYYYLAVLKFEFDFGVRNGTELPHFTFFSSSSLSLSVHGWL